jgi:Holliday junction resolvase-like predicted endonuclease
MNKKSWQGTVLDKEVNRRFRKLGDLGEYLAEKLLVKAGFKNVVNLNKEIRHNTKYFDLVAKRGNQPYAISVKARNRLENSKAGIRLNSRYKLTNDPDLFESEAREKHNCLPAWVAISLDIDAGVFDAYFGLLSDLEGNRKGIVMSLQATKRYESLAKQTRFDQMDILEANIETLKNIYNRHDGKTRKGGRESFLTIALGKCSTRSTHEVQRAADAMEPDITTPLFSFLPQATRS